jgi:hypothetical protein
MAHRHLILAYVFTILVQLGYAGWVGKSRFEGENRPLSG